MTAQSDVETQRQRYANELAEYTRRQWDLARQSLEQRRGGGGVPNAHSNNREKHGQNGRDKESSGRGGAGSQGIQSHDYAHRSHRRGGGIAHESRAVAAN
ncbi:hypothetical protein BDW22DRAFT_1427607 [Trametopsis cervina]|nr:hypothetical protein BDW22DRAFT_1427607 [Trametopsis cervina]